MPLHGGEADGAGTHGPEELEDTAAGSEQPYQRMCMRRNGQAFTGGLPVSSHIYKRDTLEGDLLVHNGSDTYWRRPASEEPCIASWGGEEFIGADKARGCSAGQDWIPYVLCLTIPTDTTRIDTIPLNKGSIRSDK